MQSRDAVAKFPQLRQEVGVCLPALAGGEHRLTAAKIIQRSGVRVPDTAAQPLAHLADVRIAVTDVDLEGQGQQFQGCFLHKPAQGHFPPSNHLHQPNHHRQTSHTISKSDEALICLSRPETKQPSRATPRPFPQTLFVHRARSSASPTQRTVFAT